MHVPWSRRNDDGHPFLRWLGHYVFFVLLVVFPLDIANDVLGLPLLLGSVAVIATGTLFTALVSDLVVHQRSLCERCIREAPVLDPQSAVIRWHRVLRLFHRLWLSAALMGASVVLDVTLPGVYAADRRIGNGWLWQQGPNVLMLIGLLYFVGLAWQHRRLQPWCPYCGWDEGGDAENVPPVPSEPVLR